MKSVIYENWKYILTSPGSEELFDREKDPKERFNKILEETDTARYLQTTLLNFENTCKKYRQEEFEIQATDELLEELEALGYVQ